MASSKTNLRSSSSIPNVLLACLNFTLFVLSAASVGPTVLIRSPPTSTGAAFLMVSGTSLVSSVVGFYSHLTHLCFVSHIALVLASLAGQILGVLALFTKEGPTLASMRSPRDPREAKLLGRMECGVLMAMVLVQAVVLALSCAVQSCWVREYEGMEAEREASAKKRSRRMARVQEESMANAEKIAEVKAREFDDKFKGKYGSVHWVKTDFEGS